MLIIFSAQFNFAYSRIYYQQSLPKCTIDISREPQWRIPLACPHKKHDNNWIASLTIHISQNLPNTIRRKHVVCSCLKAKVDIPLHECHVMWVDQNSAIAELKLKILFREYCLPKFVLNPNLRKTWCRRWILKLHAFVTEKTCVKVSKNSLLIFLTPITRLIAIFPDYFKFGAINSNEFLNLFFIFFISK